MLGHVRLALIAAGLALTSQSVWSQVLYGSALGSVSDPSHVPVPKAKIVINSGDTGLEREAVTNESGFFALRELPEGTYVLRISASGFTTYESASLPIKANIVARVDAVLQLGQVRETVTVAPSTPSIQTDTADVHTDFGQKELSDAPLSGYRNYQILFNLVPGSAPAVLPSGVSDTPERSLLIHVNGTSDESNTTRVDGAIDTFTWLANRTLYVPPSESIETVNISTGSFDAELGLVGSSAINVTTKSGTNNFHGAAFEYNTDSVMSARNFFYYSPRNPKNIQNQFGGAVGGPIRRNKLFFFADWEDMRQRQTANTTITLPTAAERGGDFSATGVTLYDPSTGTPDGKNRTPFPGAQVPSSEQTPISLKMQSYVPLPNLPGLGSNYFASGPIVFNRNNIDGKVNWNVSPKTMLWSKYSVMDALTHVPGDLGAAVGSALNGTAGTGHTLTQIAGLGFSYTHSATLVADGNVGFSRLGQHVTGPDFGTNYGLDVLGIPGTNGPDIRESGWPRFDMTGYQSFGNADSSSPLWRNDTGFTYSLNFGWTRGAHNVRFGLDISRQRMDEFQPQRGGGARGQFSFTGGVTSLSGGPAPQSANAYAAFLLGLPNSEGKSFHQFDDMNSRQWQEGYYVRDQWQVSRALTVSLGLRWELFPLIARSHWGADRYDPTTNLVLIGGQGSTPEDAGMSVSQTMFAPRAGIAYRLGENTVIRAGYGLSNDSFPFARPLRDAYPLITSLSISAANSYVACCALAQGIPAFPPINLGGGTIPIPGNVQTRTLLGGEFKRGYVESYNFTVQRKLPWSLVAQAGYVGTHSVRQSVFDDLNAGQVIGAGAAGQPLNALWGRTASTLTLIPLQSAVYNSLQAKLDRRFAQGLWMTWAYTWSKAIDLADDSDTSLAVLVPSHLAWNRAVATFDRTQNLEMSAIYQLPFGKGQRLLSNANKLTRALVSGWQLTAIVGSYTGLPFTVQASTASLNAPGNTQSADQVTPTVKTLGGIGPGAPYFDTTAFKAVTQARFGNSGRDTLRGLGTFNINMGLFRAFSLTERFNLQFRAEAFNVSNTPHFALPDATVGDSSFGWITATQGNAAGESDQRQIRLALRLSF